ncbi:MAG: thiaminase II [Bryobacterales bacterium]|nr:thiaminase II [Bryobacteraceae bacterium]MDW8353460.1 thiaminase II [Bryobacterales bacterium]
MVVPAASDVTETKFTGELWNHIASIYAQTLEHPFLVGLTDGTLSRDRFEFYLLQDSHYLRAFAQALSVLAAKAPREDWGITLNQHAVGALQVERQLHESLLASYGISPQAIAEARPAPTNYAYTNHLLAAVWQRPFAEGLAAVLPCYWIYWEVGKELKKRGSTNPDYQRWIDQYAGEEYGRFVEQVLAMMDEEGARLDAAARQRARDLFTFSARYEYMFWDMAWRLEHWLP